MSLSKPPPQELLPSTDGTIVWKFQNFAANRLSGNESFYSDPFYTHRYGYKLCVRLYLNGDGIGKETHLSVFLVIMKGEYDALLRWPFRDKVTIRLLNQKSCTDDIVDMFRPDSISSSFKRPTSEMNIATGWPKFAKKEIYETAPYVVDDCFFLHIHIEPSSETRWELRHN